MKKSNIIYMPFVLWIIMLITYISICYLLFINFGIISLIAVWLGILPIMYLTVKLSDKKISKMKYLPTTYGLYTYTITSDGDYMRLTIYQVDFFKYIYMYSIRKDIWTTRELISTLKEEGKKYDNIYKEKHKKELELKYLNEEMTTWGHKEN